MEGGNSSKPHKHPAVNSHPLKLIPQMHVQCMLSCVQDIPVCTASYKKWCPASWSLEDSGVTFRTHWNSVPTLTTKTYFFVYLIKGNGLWKAIIPDSHFKALEITFDFQDLSFHLSMTWFLAQCILVSPDTTRLWAPKGTRALPVPNWWAVRHEHV